MKVCIFFLEIIVFTLFLLLLQGDAFRKNGFCSWTTYKNSSCSRSKFLCTNGQCIDRGLYCNGRYDCQDQSDERHCDAYNNCPSGRKICPGYRKCILEEWFCDSVRDCPDGLDESNCEEKRGTELFAMSNALQWLRELHRKSGSATEMWGSSVDRAAVILYLAGNQTKDASREFIKELAYETSIQLLSRLSKKKLQDIPSTDLASYVNAFLVTCLDPRKFHGLDIVQELRSRVDRQNYTNPYVLLALCNAGDIITETDKQKLIDAFWSKHKAFWTDIQAGSLMALSCFSRQPGNGMEGILRSLAMELKQHQYRNGTVENLQTTALVMQALMAAEKDSDPDNFDDMRALEQMLAKQKEDGSFGSFMNTYYVLPVLNCRSLVDIKTDHCDPVRRDEISALDDLSTRSGPKVRVQYSLWIGDEKDLERNLALRVPANTSFYGVMEMAADLDSRFRFEYTVKNRKPYVNVLSELQDDPERGRFWFLYKLVEGKPTPSQESPADVKPIDNDHFVMWYRSGSWIN